MSEKSQSNSNENTKNFLLRVPSCLRAFVVKKIPESDSHLRVRIPGGKDNTLLPRRHEDTKEHEEEVKDGFVFPVLKAVLIAICFAAPSSAHDSPIDHVDRVVQIYAEAGRLHVIYRFRCEERQALLQLHQMDKNGDGKISDEEREAYFNSIAIQLSRQLLVEVDGKVLPLSSDGLVRLAPDLSQTYRLSAPLPNLSAGAHAGKFSDDFSRKQPGPWRWHPRQFNDSGIDVNAVQSPELEQMGPHPAMVVVRLAIVVHPPVGTQPTTRPVEESKDHR
jgi:hypothetical protein